MKGEGERIDTRYLLAATSLMTVVALVTSAGELSVCPVLEPALGAESRRKQQPQRAVAEKAPQAQQLWRQVRVACRGKLVKSIKNGDAMQAHSTQATRIVALADTLLGCTQHSDRVTTHTGDTCLP